jgi:hypothetical protein
MNWEITNKATYFTKINRKLCLKQLEISPEASLGSVVVDPLSSHRKSLIIAKNRLLARCRGSLET